MSHTLILCLFAVSCTAFPLAAQQPPGAPAHGHAHGTGHDDLEDVQAVLRMITVAQVRHRAQHGRYAVSLRELGLETPSRVSVHITASGGEGFTAVSASGSEECAIFSGRVRPPRDYVSRANELVCRAVPGGRP